MDDRFKYLINPFKSFWASLFLCILAAVLPPVLLKSFRDEAVYYPVAIGVVGYFVSRNLESSRVRYNALINMQTRLNFVVFALEDNMKLIKRCLDSDVPLLSAHVAIVFDPDVMTDIGRIDLKKDALGLSLELNRLHTNIATTVQMTQNDLDRILSDKFVQSLLLDRLKFHYSEADRLLHEAKSCLVATRFFMRNDKPMHFTFQPYFANSDLASWMIKDREQLEQELKDDKDQSVSKREAKEIDDITRGL